MSDILTRAYSRPRADGTIETRIVYRVTDSFVWFRCDGVEKIKEITRFRRWMRKCM